MKNVNGQARSTAISIALLCLVFSFSAAAAERCADWAATLASSEGPVEWSEHSDHGWHTAELGFVFCYGDKIRSLDNRAALRLANDTLVRLNANTVVYLLPPKKGFWFELLSGAAHFLSRTPKKFDVKAPYLNAAVDGTEFLVATEGETNQVAVFEGDVLVTSGDNQLRLLAGDGSSANANNQLTPVRNIRLNDAAVWTLHYPPIFSTHNITADAVAFINQAKYDQAFSILQYSNKPEEQALAASLSLTLGDKEKAQRILMGAQQNDPSIQAIQLFIQLIQGNKSEVLIRTADLRAQYPNAINLMIVHSYALQANQKLEEALSVMQHAVEIASDDMPVKARYIELLLSTGHSDNALKLLDSALKQAPNHSRLNSLAGFAQLDQWQIKKAKRRFMNAIDTDNSDALPHFGLALTYIKDGDLKIGQQQMELAVLLDPTNSLYRSYLGKTYFEINAFNWAQTQYQMAKELDPNDPTPWFYEAHLLEEQNRLPEALKSLETAIEKNDNRAVYRSKMMLDKDLASRNINLTKIYQELGADLAAQNNAVMNTHRDPINYQGYQSLAYALPHDGHNNQARMNAVLLSKLLQPIGTAPTPTGYGEPSVPSFPWSSIQSQGVNEYTSTYDKQGISGYTNFIAGTQRSLGNDTQLNLLAKNTSITIGQNKLSTDGFAENNGLDLTLSEAEIHHQLTPKLKLFARYAKKDSETGDASNSPFSSLYDSTLKSDSEYSTKEFGIKFSPLEKNMVLARYAETSDTFNATKTLDPTTEPLFSRESDFYEWKALELNHIIDFDSATLITGMTRKEALWTYEAEFKFPPPSTFNPVFYTESYESRAYYPFLTYQIRLPGNFEASTSLLFQTVDVLQSDKSQSFNKNTYNITINYNISEFSRIMYSKSTFLNNNFSRLGGLYSEASQQSNFSTGFGASNLTNSDTVRATYKKDRFSTALNLINSKNNSYLVSFEESLSPEKSKRQYFDMELSYQTATSFSFTLNSSYETQSINLVNDGSHYGDGQITNLSTHNTKITAKYFLNRNFTVQLNSNYVDQKREQGYLAADSENRKARDSTKTLNAAIQFDSPSAGCKVTVGLDNISNTKSTITNSDIFNANSLLNPSANLIAPERSLILRIQLSF